MTDEEKKAIEWLKKADWFSARLYAPTILNLIEKQSKEIEELKDTQKIEEMKKQLDLDIECEIALDSKIMDLEKEIEELKEKNEHITKETVDFVNTHYISKDEIKAKIEIRKEEKENCKDSIEEKYLLREIYVLQSLLEK